MICAHVYLFCHLHVSLACKRLDALDNDSHSGESRLNHVRILQSQGLGCIVAIHRASIEVKVEWRVRVVEKRRQNVGLEQPLQRLVTANLEENQAPADRTPHRGSRVENQISRSRLCVCVFVCLCVCLCV